VRLPYLSGDPLPYPQIWQTLRSWIWQGQFSDMAGGDPSPLLSIGAHQLSTERLGRIRRGLAVQRVNHIAFCSVTAEPTPTRMENVEELLTQPTGESPVRPSPPRAGAPLGWSLWAHLPQAYEEWCAVAYGEPRIPCGESGAEDARQGRGREGRWQG